MNILIVCSYNNHLISPFIKEQTDSLLKLDCTIEYFLIKEKGLIGYCNSIFKLVKKIKSFKPDIIHAHYGLSGLLAILQPFRPVIVTFHGSDINDPKLRFLSKIAQRFSTESIFVSDKLKSLSKSSRGVVIPCGVDLETFRPKDKENSKKLSGLDMKMKYVLFPSSFDNPVKNSSLAIESVNKLSDQNIKFLELKGYSSKEVNLLLNAIDCVLMTSFSEGSPQVIKEAIACNCPIVSTDVGDVKNVFGNSDGCYITTYDTEDIAEKIKLAIEFRKNHGFTSARKRILELGIDSGTIANRINGIYNDVLRKRKDDGYCEIELVKGTKNKYSQYLALALEQLFTSKDLNGFWDEEKGVIVEKISYTAHWDWQFETSKVERYGPFALSNVLIAKNLFGLDTSLYDDKIILYLNHLYSKIDDYSVTSLTYGVLLSIVIGKTMYDLQNFKLDRIIEKFKVAIRQASNLNENQHSLILVSGKFLYDINQDESVFNGIKLLTTLLLKSQNAKGYFETYDIRSSYHQRNMYVLWGICFAGQVLPSERDNIARAIEKTLEWAWKLKRDLKDNAFIWHPSFYFNKTRWGFKIPILSSKSAKYLFECHQTFFVNAVNFYQLFYGRKDYSNERIKAIDWLYGDNRLNINLVDITKINLPVRIMDTNGNLFIKGQQFKGSYEVGSYILALSGLLKLDKSK